MQALRTTQNIECDNDDLRAARRQVRPLLCCVVVFGAVANLLLLTGPLYMMQVYDRVLSSKSVETLVVLSGIVLFLLTIMAVLDYVRARLMARAALRVEAALQSRVFDAGLGQAARGTSPGLAEALRDLDAVQRVIGAPVTTALFDLPWAHVFLAGIWLFHHLLGMLASAGALGLIALAICNQRLTRRSVAQGAQAGMRCDHLAENFGNDAETVRALGMRAAAARKWSIRRAAVLRADLQTGDTGGSVAAGSRAIRLMLQSAMLGLGAYLVLHNALTAGAMIAGSVLMGRALAPIEQMIAGWPLIQRGLKAWQGLGALLNAQPVAHSSAHVPPPPARLEVRQLSVVPPGARKPALRAISFALEPGQAVGVIGASGAGKTTLARTVAGLWPAFSGEVTLGGTPADAYAPDMLGALIGYLPQRVALFDGTVAENIARLDRDAPLEAITDAARAADAHAMITALPQGYETMLSPTGGALSGGQVQRIALARALYGDPILLVLDEPNASLDNAGTMAVNAAIRTFKEAGKIVLVMAHRPAAIEECDHLMMIENGIAKHFGPRDDVLRASVRNHAQLVPDAPAQAAG